ncbi:lysosome membrane protein 2 isoform X2 [Eurytemora carolleeae]|uniref:lysosome membrane protein 2 isoform X2 n=1 Tax=Eurytemora carolleeae TaxID=1294199 RepID=UPI000C757AB3|nr:lysosome membrane protein 2 isoform X2 [Eurytemora carolleeae]|eukprot:XP_023349462.1 lysosome membrane protein 2-like isoform X2 [Eurytemora affinis]
MGYLGRFMIKLSPDNTEIWDTWIEPTAQLPVYMKFTFLNVTNPEEIKDGEKPIVNEVGPFAYREVRRKDGVTIMDDSISYGSYISYELDENESCPSCTEDTMITVINPALAGIVTLIEDLAGDIEIDLGYGPQTVASLILSIIDAAITERHGEYEDDLFTTETANKLIFEGYEPGVLKFVLYLVNAIEETPEEILFPVEDLPPIEIPDIIADGKFAFFKGKNGTADNGWYKINSGIYDISKYQKIQEYNGLDRLPESWWGTLASTPSANRSGVTGYCHELVGTDGTQYPPFVSMDNDIWLFSSDLCRSIYLSFYEEHDMDGINTYQFRVKKEVLSFDNPDNACFCPNVEECVEVTEDKEEWDFSNCTHCKNGMLNLMGCQGAPVIISLPHFLDADQDVVDAIQGMNPNPDLHTTFLNIEPLTGVSLDAHKRIQVNVPLKQNDAMTLLKNVREAIFPVVWVDEGATLDGENLDKLKAQLVTPFKAVDIGVGFMIGLGAIIIIVISLISLLCGKK